MLASRSDPRLARVAAAIVVVVAAVIPYLPTLDNYFAQDDFGVVGLLAGKPAGAFPRWFVTTWMDDIWGFTPDEIRPFPAVTYQVAALWGAGSPVANHVINIALHAANSLLVLRLGQVAAGLGPGAALVGAVAFAILPMQTESVAWITGRVDTIPAFFYLWSFLLYARWRAGTGAAAGGDGEAGRGRGRVGLYGLSIAAFFCALFSKQNAITLPPALVLYDLLVVRLPARALPRAALAYLPFALLTAGYLWLRYALFGEVAREGLMTGDRLALFLADASVHLRRMVFGEYGLSIGTAPAAAMAVAAAAAMVAVAWRARGPASARLGRSALYFGGAWIALGIAPTLVAGYASPRHMYLASAGWGVLLGIGLAALWGGRGRWPKAAAVLLAVAILGGYGLQLAADVRRWEHRTDLSRRALQDLEREALAAPPGTLFIVGVPRSSWDFSLPHALRPPFTREDLTRRVSVISDSSLHCCPAHLWEAATRAALRTWLADPRRRPVVAMSWDPASGELSRVSDREEPFLRTIMTYWLETPDGPALERQMHDALERLVAGRGGYR